MKEVRNDPNLVFEWTLTMYNNNKDYSPYI